MRVLLLVTDSYGQSGGIAKYNRDFIECLCTNPLVSSVRVVPRHFEGTVPDLGAKLSINTAGTKGKFAWAIEAFREAARGADAIICGHINLLPVAAAIKLAVRRPMALIVHGIDAWTRHPSKSVRNALPRVDAVWAVSSLTRDRMAAWSGLSIERFSLLPGTVDLGGFGLAPPNAALARRLGIDGSPVLLTVARMPSAERYKGIDEILEIMPELRQRYPSIVYAVAGDGEDRLRLEGKAKALGVAGSVKFLGFVPEQDKADIYRLADVFVMPGRGEGFGLVFLEAMASGTPVVGSAVDGSKDALREGELGELVDPGRPDEILAAIERSLAKPRAIPPGLAYFARPSFATRAAEALASLASAGKAAA